MSIKGWQYSCRRTDLYEYERRVKREYNNCRGMGFVYAVKIPVTHSVSLLKIGATGHLQGRFAGNFPRNTIYAVSPYHYNFFDNEDRIHTHFEKYRVPARVNAMPELFNISTPFFFKNLPVLHYEKDKESCYVEYYGTDRMEIYTSKAYDKEEI